MTQDARPQFDEKKLRARLNEERERTLASIKALRAEELALAEVEATEGGGLGEGGDVGTELGDRELDIGLEQSERQHLEEVEAALQRLDAGTYGICVECGQPIGPERLEALPWTTHCIRCQQRVDAEAQSAV